VRVLSFFLLNERLVALLVHLLELLRLALDEVLRDLDEVRNAQAVAELLVFGQLFLDFLLLFPEAADLLGQFLVLVPVLGEELVGVDGLFELELLVVLD